MSDADVNFLNAIASGAVHLTGILPPYFFWIEKEKEVQIDIPLVKLFAVKVLLTRVVYASLAFSISLDKPKSAILQINCAFTKTFRAAKSRWT